MQVKLKNGKAVIGNTSAETAGEDASMALYGGFRTAVKAGISVRTCTFHVWFGCKPCC
jgi:hypothetical protein